MSISIEEQLAQTQKELNDLKVEYQEFAYAVSHDLGAPFRQIDGFAKIIAKNNNSQFDQKTNQQFNLITKGAHRGMSIVDVLLDFSRLNTRAEPFEDVDCNNIVSEVLASFSNTIDKTNAQIDCDNLPTVQGDKKQLKMLFHHLIDNALIYQVQQNEPHIIITSKDVDKGWEFTVEDNGLGIHPHSQEKIFKVLHRDVTNTEQTGNGMGLALAKKIVLRHNGSIHAEPSSQGARFQFTIETAAS